MGGIKTICTRVHLCNHGHVPTRIRAHACTHTRQIVLFCFYYVGRFKTATNYELHGATEL